MATSTRKSSQRRLRFCTFPRNKTAKRTLISTMRAALIAGIAAGAMILPPTRSAQQQVCFNQSKPNCPKSDLAFIIDRSGSMAIDQVGQNYNVEIEGVLRALRDPSVIPRDGSVAVAVETFAGDATIIIAPLREINTAADAEAVAAIVEGLRCTTTTCNPTGVCPSFGPNPASRYGIAISTAYAGLNQNHRPGARQVMLLSSDGQPTDMPDAMLQADQAMHAAELLGIQLELNLILMTLDPDAKEDPNNRESAFELYRKAKKIADDLVFPKPADDLPGETLVIKRGDCNNPCASLIESAVRVDCDRQVAKFAEHTRDVLRGPVAKFSLSVNTEADPPPNTPVIGNTLSLRQAIEIANSNCGAATITFTSGVKTIRPLVPLPALTAPEIKIDGIDGCNGPNCPPPPVTIDGSQTDTTKGEQHSDGILIRSTVDEVRGLKIINFKRAGVGIGAGCLTDNVGSSRIELNRFENNKEAGVSVIDPPAGQLSAVFHNVRNTISMNDISGSATLIDLGLDGPTPNDSGDPDQGPNTLLNFPDELKVPDLLDVTATAAGVSLTGQVNGPTAAGATVEIFIITSFRPAPGGRAIDGVTFLKQATTNANGSFTVTGLADSPTCGYTATVTDLAGNTSELMFPCGGFPKAKVTNPDFGAAAVPNQNPQTGTFSIENTGCAPLAVRFVSITRDDFSRRRNDDSAHFGIQSVILGGSQPITIQPGQKQTFTATFDPAIPRVFTGNRPPASLVLPDTVKSTVTLEHNGCGNKDREITLTGQVNRKVNLIHPSSPRNAPQVTLERSGDDLFVTFSVFDSDLDVSKVNYEFFKIRDGLCSTAEPPVPVEIFDPDLTKVIGDRKLRTGQSFTVIQRFTRANKHPEAGCVRVTVSDKSNNTDVAASSPTSGSMARRSFESQSLRRSEGAVIVRGTLELPSTSRGSSPAFSNRATRELINARKSRGAGGVGAGEGPSRIRDRRTR